MAGRIPDETLQAIRDRISLVEVVSTYVSLRRAGRNHIGLCPFHDEKTPSFTVNEERGLFHCFGCGAGGTVFHFVMRMERLEFPEAVEQLAKQAGVALPARGGDGAGEALRERLYGANAQAESFFRGVLSSDAGAAARRYLSGRGLRQQSLERYGIGFAPASGTALAEWLVRQQIPREVAVQAGLLGQRDGRVYDRFRGRVMFPIRDRRGRVIAFGGRTLGTDQPKYLNSPESPVFRKGGGLYGLAEAREGVRAADRAVIVEGYMDALLLVQEGIPYAVATLGTALTAAQLRLVRAIGGDRLTIFFFFDGDRAGRSAAMRAFGVCAEAGVWGRAAFLPQGEDPDSYIRGHGAEATLALLDSAPVLSDFYLDALVPPAASLPERMRAAEEVKRILARVRDDIQFELLSRQAASRLGIDEEVFRRARAGSGGEVRVAPRPSEPARTWPVEERMLVEAMAADREVARWVPRHGALELFSDPVLAQAGREIGAAWEGGRPLGEVVERLPENLASYLTASLLGEGAVAAASDRMKMAEDCVKRIEERAARARRRAVVAEVRRAESIGDDNWRTALVSLNEMRRRQGGGA